MIDRHNPFLIANRHRATSTLTPAFAFSVAVHAAAAGILFKNWPVNPVELARPLTVMLESPPTPTVPERPRSPPVAHKQAMAEPKSRDLPVQPLHPPPAPSMIAVERVDAAPAVTAPIVEAPPAPIVAARVPSSVSAPARADAIEPPHFNVAYLNNPRPAYPPIARKLGLEGLVLLRVEVSASGAPEKVVVAQTSGASLLDEAAMKAVQGWTFVPARRGDTPIAHPVEVPIRFQLKN